MSLLDRSPAFIVGAQRSGTTWVQRMLCAHPHIVGGQESHLFSGYLAPLWQRWEAERDLRAGGSRTVGLACYLTEDELAEECRRLARRVFERLEQAKPAATLLVEKTPDHGLHLPLIKRLFPDAVILHVVRDGRDAVASLLHANRRPWGKTWAPATAEWAARRWVRWVRSIRRDLSAFPRQRTVRYEDLVANGPAELADLFDFLGMSLPPEEVEGIHDRMRFDGPGGRDSLVIEGECKGSGGEPEGFYRRGRSGGWQDDLSPRDQATVHTLAGDLLRELAYPVPGETVRATESVPLAPLTAESPDRFVSTAASDDVLWAWPARLDVIDTCRAQMLHRERLYLYATILALAPERCLEVGVAEGGSTRIIHAALCDLGRGRLMALDPQPALGQDAELLSDRVTFLAGPSPEALGEARTLAGGLFDFVLLDGDHSCGAVLADLAGLATVIRPGGLVLAHDAYFPETAAGIDAALQAGLPFTDAGLVSTTRHPGRQGSQPVDFAGFRLLVRSDRRVPSRFDRFVRLLPRRIARKLARWTTRFG